MSDDEEKRLLNLIYWGRAGIGLGWGALLAAFWRPYLGGILTAASMSIFAYLATYLIIAQLLGKHRVELIGGRNKLYTIGIGAFFLSVAFAWILIYSLFFHNWQV
ncbi:MAG TPA: hypothetical protein VEG31_02715 [Thermoproteota archaeon]|nr:hypothetical protein [Thermoproteota archaeon]